MTMTRTFLCWRSAGLLPVYRTLVGEARRGPGRMTWQTQFRSINGVDYVNIPLTLDAFEYVGDARMLDVACPCGEVIVCLDVGDLLREIYRHCSAAGHPRPIFEE